MQNWNWNVVLQAGPVIPVIVIHELEQAVPMAQALVRGGVTVLELTLRTPVALEAIQRIANEVPEAVVGAGTVRSGRDAEKALAAGARFAVSPGATGALVRDCQSIQLPLLPGVATASEVMQAQEWGLDFLKFFPAVAAGGLAMLKSWAGPFQDVRFCPTGGLSVQTAPEFLALPNVPVCGGSWLTPDKAMSEGQWAHIEALARQASALRTPAQ